MDWLTVQFLNNSLQSWLIALLVFALTFIGIRLLARILINRLARLPDKPGQQFEDLVQDLLLRIRSLFIMLIALYLGAQVLTLPEPVDNLLRTIAVVALILQFAFWGLALIDFLINRQIQADARKGQDSATAMKAVKLIALVALWSLTILLILENATSIEVNTLIASLGIGGIAVALAVQNVLGDLFSAISIALDKPFAIGDAISVGGMSGAVEDIGLKSTRVRSVNGELLVFSNSDLLSSRIQNFQTMARRRVGFTLGVTYQTPYEKLAAIPAMIQEIIEAQEQTTFDRAFFTTLGDSALLFDCAYYIETADFQRHIQALHAINMAIYQRFEAEGIELAYPTQTVYLEKPNDHLAA